MKTVEVLVQQECERAKKGLAYGRTSYWLIKSWAYCEIKEDFISGMKRIVGWYYKDKSEVKCYKC